jgi:hypothetical protein
MTLAEFLAKYEGILLSSPMTRAAIIDLVQDEVARERWECVEALKRAANEYDHERDNDEYYSGYKQGIRNGIAAIRNRNTKELD